MDATRGLDRLMYLAREQGRRFLRCREAGHGCAWRFRRNGQGKETDKPLLCGHITAMTRCKHDRDIQATQGQ